MVSCVLIANRGEIACRIIRTARVMGLRTVAVYSQADRHALHVEHADMAFPVGGPRAADSYLRIDAILEAARAGGADCVHPGYGFLAENAAFAEACAVEGLVFVGPPTHAIRVMGRKDEARALMAKSGVPVLPGGESAMQDEAGLAEEAERIGYPVMLKAAAGGGGKGMRLVGSRDELGEAIAAAAREAQASFGDTRLLLEKYLARARHVEVQIAADKQGNCVHLFERDCTLQRRHQKVIEEAPAPGMPGALRTRMTEAAIKAASAVGYTGLGTVEFLIEGDRITPSTNFYFLEMNTRLQVEHPVTEAITGLDLVEWQFRIASGESLPLRQEAIAFKGHAVEARLYAEDPDRGFLPSSGRLHAVRWPEGAGVRVDTGVRTGDTVSPYYDPMLAKVIAHGSSRDKAIARLRAALEATLLAGPGTNLAFLHELLDEPHFAAGAPFTALIGQLLKVLETPGLDAAAVAAGARALLLQRRDGITRRRARFARERTSPWEAQDGFSISGVRSLVLPVIANGAPVEVSVVWGAKGPEVTFDGAKATGDTDGIDIAGTDDGVIAVRAMRQTDVRPAGPAVGAAEGGSGDSIVRAPMHGRITKLYTAPGAAVGRGERLAVLEAMKMEHVLHAPAAGTVKDVRAREGDQVEQGAAVVLLEPGGGK